MGRHSGFWAGGTLSGHAGVVRAGLVAAGYAPSSVAVHLAMLGVLDRRCVAEQVGPLELTEARIAGLLVGTQVQGRLVTVRRLGPVLRLLRAAGLIPVATPPLLDATGLLVAQYAEFLRSQRRLAPLTVQHRAELAARFCRAMLAEHGPDWQVGSVRVADLHGFLFAHALHATVAGTRTVGEILRCWCRFLFAAGHTGRDLSGAVPAPAGFRQSGLPKALDEATVAALLGSCDRGSVTGLRDLAVMTLMLRLGLRANEIACLQLQDVHWRTGEVEIHGKGGRLDRLPLPTDVGEVLVAYLQARPTSASRAVWSAR